VVINKHNWRLSANVTLVGKERIATSAFQLTTAPIQMKKGQESSPVCSQMNADAKAILQILLLTLQKIGAALHGLKRVLVKMILIVRVLIGVKTYQELLQLEHAGVSSVKILPIADSTKSVMIRLKHASLTPQSHPDHHYKCYTNLSIMREFGVKMRSPEYQPSLL